MSSILSPKMMLAFPNEPVVWCPGCNRLHRFNVYGPNEVTGAKWSWDKNAERPTFTPSLKISMNGGKDICHSFLQNGQWKFLNDCTHHLAGKTVDLPDLPDWAVE